MSENTEDQQQEKKCEKKSYRELADDGVRNAGNHLWMFFKAAVIAVPAAGLTYTATTLYHNSITETNSDSLSSNPQPPISIDENIQVIPSDTNVTVVSHGIPCSIPLDDPSIVDVTFGNTGEATLDGVTSFLETLGISTQSRVSKKPADNTAEILETRYKAAAECREDILEAMRIQNAFTLNAQPSELIDNFGPVTLPQGVHPLQVPGPDGME